MAVDPPGLPEVERWDDSFELDAHQSLQHLFDQLHRHLPRSPLSDSSDQSDYFQSPLDPRLRPRAGPPRRLSCSSYTHALPSPPTTTTATTLLSSRTVLSDCSTLDRQATHSTFKRLVASPDSLPRPRHLLGSASSSALVLNGPSSSTSTGLASSPHPHRRTRDRYPTTDTKVSSPVDSDMDIDHKDSPKEPPGLPPLCTAVTLSHESSASSSPRAITASVTAPSTTAASRRSYLETDKEDSKVNLIDSVERPTTYTKPMTTITQEMMLANLPAYTGIITRINPIKRVAAWVDDLEDLEVPEKDLDFSRVRSILGQTPAMPETLESIDAWDTSSEFSASKSDDQFMATSSLWQESQGRPQASDPVDRREIGTFLKGSVVASENAALATTLAKAGHPTSLVIQSETIETLDDDFDFPEGFGSLRLSRQGHGPILQQQGQQEQPRRHLQPSEATATRDSLSQRRSSLLRWQDSGSDMDDLDFAHLDSRSLSSSGSFSRDSVGDDENFSDGIVFPEEPLTSLLLVTNRPYRPEAEPSIFGKESRFQDDQEDIWEGLDVDLDEVFHGKGRNKNVVMRAVSAATESRVQREVVPLKDFVALPSRIPRLCRHPGDTSRPVTPAPSLSRKHSTQMELPLRNLRSMSSLPRLKRPSISRRDASGKVSTDPVFDAVAAKAQLTSSSNSSSSSINTLPLASRSPTPTTLHLFSSKRSSLVINRDDLTTSAKTPSLVMRAVSFSNPPAAGESSRTSMQGLQPTLSRALFPPFTPDTASQPQALQQPSGSAAAAAVASNSTAPPKPSTPRSISKAFPSLRMLVRKLDLSRPRISARGLIPAFEPAAPPAVSQHPIDSPIFTERNTRSTTAMATMAAATAATTTATTVATSVVTLPDHSRSSSYTDWSSILASTETTKQSRISSMAGLVLEGETMTEPVATPVVAADRFSRRLFLKRSPKHSAFGDGSELDQFDNLPTFGVSSSTLGENEMMVWRTAVVGGAQVQVPVMTQVQVQGRKQPTDRVAAWLRKPQSLANIKEVRKTQVSDHEPVATAKIQKSRSIRKSLFDIFGQSAMQDSKDKEVNDLNKTERKGRGKRRKRKTSKGPTLIRDLSQSPRARNVSGMVYNPKDKMWDGNDDILDEFENEGNTYFPYDSPSSPSAYSSMPTSPHLGVSRPALISNMSQYSTQQPQISGRMMFDPARMCWVLNPEYIARRRRQRQGHRSPPPMMDDIWGDEPDVFADLSDSERSEDKAEQTDKQDIEYENEGTTAGDSIGRARSPQLLSRPSFQRQSSTLSFSDQQRLKSCPESMSGTLPVDGTDGRLGSMGNHTIIPKSSRRSLNGVQLPGCFGGGGGYSSRGEFEVGVEFDITESFLEQCITTEAQHRKEAGRFFALPCSSNSPQDLLAVVPNTVVRKRSSRMLSLGRNSVKFKGKGKDKDKDKDKEKEKEKDKERGEDAEGLSRELLNDNDMVPRVDAKERVLNIDEDDTDINLESHGKGPLFSWPSRHRSKSRPTVAHLLDGGNDKPAPQSSTQRSLTWRVKKGGLGSALLPSLHGDNDDGNMDNPHRSKGKGKTKHKSLGRAGLFFEAPPAATPLSATPSPSPSVAPAAVTMAARGRSGTHGGSLHRLPTKPDSMRGTLSFSATLAVARRGPLSADRRRIGNHTFEPPSGHSSHMKSMSTSISSDQPTAKSDRSSFTAAEGGGYATEDSEDEGVLMGRGYRVMSQARARPPMQTRSQLILEFERYAGHRHRPQ